MRSCATMDGPEVARVARALTATVRVRGPDPRHEISRRASFFLSSSSSSSTSPASHHGTAATPITSLSATALRLPSSSPTSTAAPPISSFSSASSPSFPVVFEHLIAPLSVFLPFLTDADALSADENGARPLPGGGDAHHSPLTPGTEVHIMRRGAGSRDGGDGGEWVRARVMAIFGMASFHSCFSRNDTFVHTSSLIRTPSAWIPAPVLFVWFESKAKPLAK